MRCIESLIELILVSEEHLHARRCLPKPPPDSMSFQTPLENTFDSSSGKAAERLRKFSWHITRNDQSLWESEPSKVSGS